MKKFKTYVALILALCLILAVSPQAFAAGAYTLNQVANPDCVFNYIYYGENPYGFLMHNYGYDASGNWVTTSCLYSPNGMVVPMGEEIRKVCDNGLVIYNDHVSDIYGNIILPKGKYAQVAYIDDEHLYCAIDTAGNGNWEDYKCAITDMYGNPVTEFKYGPDAWVDGVLVIYEENGQYVLDLAGNEIVTPGMYESVSSIGVKDKFVAKQGEFYTLYDLKGNAIFQSPEWIRAISDNLFETYDYDADTTIIYDVNGNVFLETEGYVSNNDKYIAINSENGAKLIDFNKNVIFEEGMFYDINIYLSKGDYFVVCNENYEYAIVDKSGNFKVPYGQYEYIQFMTDDLYNGSFSGGVNVVSVSTGEVVLSLGANVWTYLTCNDGFLALEFEDGSHQFFTLSKNEAAATNEVSVTVNGVKITFDQPPIIQDGRTLVPVRAIFEALGATVEWNNDTRSAISTLGNITVTIPIDSNTMTVNNSLVALDVPAQIAGGRTLVPVRAVSEAFGCDVQWNNDTRTVVITK